MPVAIPVSVEIDAVVLLHGYLMAFKDILKGAIKQIAVAPIFSPFPAGGPSVAISIGIDDGDDEELGGVQELANLVVASSILCQEEKGDMHADGAADPFPGMLQTSK